MKLKGNYFFSTSLPSDVGAFNTENTNTACLELAALIVLGAIKTKEPLYSVGSIATVQ